MACLRELNGLLEVMRFPTRVYYSSSFEYVRLVVTSLFGRFRRGLSRPNVDVSTAALTQSSTEWTKVGRAGRNLALLKQIAFVRSIASEDVCLGDGLRGHDALLDQCWRYSVLYKNFCLQLLGIDPLPASHAEEVPAASCLFQPIRTFP